MSQQTTTNVFSRQLAINTDMYKVRKKYIMLEGNGIRIAYLFFAKSIQIAWGHNIKSALISLFGGMVRQLVKAI